MRVLATVLIWVMGAALGLASPVAAQSRLVQGGAQIVATDAGGVTVRFAISQAVPFSVHTRVNPMQVILDTQQVDWSELQANMLTGAPYFTDLRVGRMRSGWSRLVLTLAAPMAIDQAGLQQSDTGAQLMLKLVPTTADHFAALAHAPDDPRFTLAPPVLARAAAIDKDALHVVLDPGHGGIDPGATRGTITEADLMLSLARQVQEALLREGIEVTLTRAEDDFIPLPQRVAIAHDLGADLFISLHADTVEQGQVSGASVYTLAQQASDTASARLAAEHDRDALLAGVDLQGQKDDVARVLMDLARLDTQPRSESLATHMVGALAARVPILATQPHRQADFSVLRSADIPSVLIEAGFLSSQADLTNLQDPKWRAGFTAAIVEGITVWADEDALLAPLRRK